MVIGPSGQKLLDREQDRDHEHPRNGLLAR